MRSITLAAAATACLMLSACGHKKSEKAEAVNSSSNAAASANEDVDRKFFRRGIADLVYRDDGGRFVIVDYKTGIRSPENLADYREQLASYRAALAAAGFAEAKLLLWFVEADDAPVEVH